MDVQKDNRKKLRAYLAMGGLILLTVTILAGFIKELRSNNLLYAVAAIVCLALMSVERAFPEENGLLLSWLMYALSAMLYILGIALAMRSPEELSVSFIAFTCVVPLLFTMPPILNILNVAFFDTIFIVLCRMLESNRPMVVDIVDCVFFGVVSCIISTFMATSLYQNFVSSSKLREMANQDVLTGMQSRNSYEEGRPEWARRCTLSLSCVYVDVNGLHELNNTQGHEKGDQMLRTVAREMRAKFGEQNCYRIGGDEFVAFVLDKQYAAVRASVEELNHAVQQQGYSVAVGVATQSAGGIDVDKLVKTAEMRMYTAKEEYYRTMGNAVR